MLNNKSGLGRGLSSLIPNRINNNNGNGNIDGRDVMNLPAQAGGVLATGGAVETGTKSELDLAKGLRILEIDIEKIKANPYQPRTDFNHDGMEDLINSIKEHGILQPLVVSKTEDGQYELIAGERRLRASKMAELRKVPVIVRDADRQKKLELALIENIQRRDLNPMEECTAYKRLMDEFNMTQDDVCKKVGKSLAVVANTLRLLGLPKEIQDALSQGKIDKSAGRAIAGLEGDEEQLKLFKELIERGINVRQLENYVRSKKRVGFKKINVIDPDLEEKNDMLQVALGTKVRIDKKGAQGKIMIDFYSEEELGEIVNKICRE
ncbi:MAG: ParB/RepB/Spo0J family partition protein [bacterium]